MDPLLVGIGARSYKQPAQRYELAAACLRHLTMCVRYLHATPSPAHSQAGSYVLSQLLSPTNVLLRELLTHVASATQYMHPLAVDALSGLVVQDADAGRAAEGAIEALFDLFNAVFEDDLEWVRVQRQRQHVAEPLHALLMRPPAMALQLLQFVAYSDCAEIQLGAVRMLGAISTRDAGFTHAMLQLPAHVRKLVYDCAMCLGENLFVASGTASGGTGESSEAGVAELLLQVLLDNARTPFPNFTQLALGYAVQQVLHWLACNKDAIFHACTNHARASRSRHLAPHSIFMCRAGRSAPT